MTITEAIDEVNVNAAQPALLNTLVPRANAARENPIENLAAQLQKLPPEIRWLYIWQEAIRATALGAPIVFGRKRRVANRILSLAVVPALARLVACAASFILIVNIWRNRRTSRGTRLAPTIFIGIGALRDNSIVHALEHERAEVMWLKETMPETFAEYFSVGLADLLREWRAVRRDVWKELDGGSSKNGLSPHNLRLAFMTQAHDYAWFRAWFRQLKIRNQTREPVVFSAASHVSYAAISAGFSAAYHLHGFQSRTLVYPEFTEVRCFTFSELQQMQRRLPYAHVELATESSAPIATLRAVAVAGAYGQSVGFDDCTSFIEWAKRNGIPVILRPHPLDKSGFYERWRDDPAVAFSTTAVPFEKFLEQVRPRLLLSWYSTALYDALRRGVVPVTVSTEPWRSLEMVFPFSEISLHWPEGERFAASFMDNDSERLRFLEDRRALAGIKPTP